jgi:chromosome segregation ATPase
LAAALAASDKAVTAALAASDRAVAKAEAASEKRFDNVNGFKEMMRDQAAQFMTRAEHAATLDGQQKELDAANARIDAKVATVGDKFDAEMKPLAEKIEAMGRPNWPFMASVATVLTLMVSGVWLIIGLKIDAVITPVLLDQHSLQATSTSTIDRLHTLEAATSGSASADEQSRTDRNQLNARMRELETRVTSNAQERRSQLQTINAKLIEVETQFCASDIVRNLMHATDMRLTSILWHKAFPETTMPTDNALYPIICNRGRDPGSQ